MTAAQLMIFQNGSDSRIIISEKKRQSKIRYTGKTLHKESKAAANKYGPNHATQHSSDVDHVTPLAKIHKQYSSNEFLDTTDLKKIGNIDANYQVIASTVNRQKGEKTNFEYIKNADIPVVGKMVMNQVSSETAIGIEAAKLTTKNILKSETRLCEEISVKTKTVIKTLLWSGMKICRSYLFTVYNEYCNLSRYFGYQPDVMERSGMESG